MLSVVTFGGVFGHFGMRFPPLGSVKLWTKKRLQKLQPKSNPIYPKALGFIRWVFCRCQIRQHFSDDDIDEKEMLRWFEEFQHKY